MYKNNTHKKLENKFLNIKCTLGTLRYFENNKDNVTITTVMFI